METIDEDMPALDRLGVRAKMNIMEDPFNDDINHIRSGEISTFINDKRRHSDSDILDQPSPYNRYHKRRQQAHGNKRSSNPEIKKSDRPRNARRKSYGGLELGPDFDTFSEASDVHSQKSSKSRLSVCSDNSLSSASKLAARRRSEADGLSVGKFSKASLQASLVKHEAKDKQGSVNGAMNRTDNISNIMNSTREQSKRNLSMLSAGSEEPSPFSTLEIPIEFLDISTSRVRKMVSPVVISLITITLLACLSVAVYFAVVLKDSQEKQIEFLQVTLGFVLAGEQQEENINRMTSSELTELKLAYCQQVDAIYKTSTLTTKYRGCEVETLT
ncbi:unnamed protein product, partial [Candidula unifasciata]